MDNLKDRVTIYQVAQTAHVSLATVSRVINKQSNVTEETRKRVEETIKKLGYKPSALAQALATNRSTNIGVIIPAANYVYIANMLNGITEVAKQKGFSITLFTTGHSREEALSMLEKVITAHVDGVIIFDDELDQDDVNNITSYNVPTIVVNNQVTAERAGCIIFHLGATLRKIIASYYKNGGDKPVTFLHVHNCGRLLARCEKGYVEEQGVQGKEVNLITCDDSYTKTYDLFLEYFKNNKKGYFIAYRDSIASAVLNAATDSGLKIPEDVEVLSLVGTKYAQIVRPSLTALHIDMAEVGRRSMNMLISLFNKELLDKTAEFSGTYTKRQSTKF